MMIRLKSVILFDILFDFLYLKIKKLFLCPYFLSRYHVSKARDVIIRTYDPLLATNSGQKTIVFALVPGLFIAYSFYILRFSVSPSFLPVFTFDSGSIFEKDDECRRIDRPTKHSVLIIVWEGGHRQHGSFSSHKRCPGSLD